MTTTAGAGAAWVARAQDGRALALPIGRWLGAPTAAERALLASVEGPALDVGCGPGRLVAALTARGVPALGVDVVPAAVEAARRRGAPAVVADVLRAVPLEGAWATALLLDGAIGIGGSPGALLSRLAVVLRAAGEIFVELAPPPARTERLRLRIESSDACGSWFPWARVSAAGIESMAAASGFGVAELWAAEARWFARLTLDG